MSDRGTAIVTGGARGIGAVIARRLADDGYAPLLVDRDESVLAAAEALGAGARGLVADLASDEGVAAVVAACAEQGAPPLRLLVNNAGITRDGRAGDLTPEDFRIVVEVNLVAAMRVTLALEHAFAEGAAVVNMSSRAGLGNFGQANYTASKAGLVGFTRALAQTWAPRVRVNAVAPGLIDTPMTQAMPERVLDKLVARIPAGRIGTPADVAAVVAFLASEDAGYVTGQVVLACGGRSVGP